MSFISGSWPSVVWGPWDKEFPHCVPRTRERRSREPVKMLFHFHVGRASARAGVPSDVPWAPAVQARPEMRSRVRAYPRKQRRASARTVVPSHQAMARGAKRARVLKVSRARAHLRKQGIRTGYAFLELREGVGVRGQDGFHSRVWRSVRTSTPGHAVQSRSSLRNRKRALHNTQLCSNRLVTEAGPARPKELPGCMSVLLCRRAGEFQQRVMAVSGLGPVGQGISALCSAHPRAAEPRACQDVVPFSCGLGVSARRGSIGCAQCAGGASASRDAEPCACVSQEATAWSARTVVPSHRAMARGAKRARVLQAGYPAPVRIGGNRVSARLRVSGNARGKWSSSASGRWRRCA